MSALGEQRDDTSGDKQADNWLVYDGECPFCSQYVKLLRIRETAGPLRIINARDGGEETREVAAAGFDLNEGMVLKMSDRL
ncbi:MAG: DCC1-like thiol-disulfide oxidoreductase family protein, partial [Pseudomonadota bacterium]|nr:DCC1-like thiol-disulfide oxidoreductase family protein [Pseudomonadota bacterium]